MVTKRGNKKDESAFRISLLIVLLAIIVIGLITIVVALNSYPTSSTVVNLYPAAKLKAGPSNSEVAITIFPSTESLSNQSKGNP